MKAALCYYANGSFFLHYDLPVGVKVVIGSDSWLTSFGYVRYWDSIKGKGGKKGKFSALTVALQP